MSTRDDVPEGECPICRDASLPLVDTDRTPCCSRAVHIRCLERQTSQACPFCRQIMVGIRTQPPPAPPSLDPLDYDAIRALLGPLAGGVVGSIDAAINRFTARPIRFSNIPAAREVGATPSVSASALESLLGRIIPNGINVTVTTDDDDSTSDDDETAPSQTPLETMISYLQRQRDAGNTSLAQSIQVSQLRSLLHNIIDRRDERVDISLMMQSSTQNMTPGVQLLRREELYRVTDINGRTYFIRFYA